MSFADWKKRSKVYDIAMAHLNDSRHVRDACGAAYKAGVRAGMALADGEADTRQAIERCAQIATQRRQDAANYGVNADLYRAQGAEECVDALRFDNFI